MTEDSKRQEWQAWRSSVAPGPFPLEMAERAHFCPKCAGDFIQLYETFEDGSCYYSCIGPSRNGPAAYDPDPSLYRGCGESWIWRPGPPQTMNFACDGWMWDRIRNSA